MQIIPLLNLCTAVEHNDLAVAERMLCADPTLVHRADADGYRPIHYLEGQDCGPMLHLLMRYGSDFIAGQTVLDCYTRHHHTFQSAYVIRLLLDYGARPNTRHREWMHIHYTARQRALAARAQAAVAVFGATRQRCGSRDLARMLARAVFVCGWRAWMRK